MALYNLLLRSYSVRTELILLSLTYNLLTVSLNFAQLLQMLSDIKQEKQQILILKSLV